MDEFTCDERRGKENDICSACSSSLDAFAEHCKNQHWQGTIPHHKQLQGLADGAASGCSLCSLLHPAFLATIRSTPGWSVNELGVMCRDDGCEPALSFLPIRTGVYTPGIKDKRYDGALQMQYMATFEGKYWRGSPLLKLVFDQVAGDDPVFLGKTVANEPPLQLAKDWITTCFRVHEDRCGPLTEQLMPPRLIDLGPSCASIPRLIETTYGQRGQYAALSHCWGTQPPRLVTRKCNLEMMCHSIPVEQLAKNWRDAIAVARRLGFRYLWIDSLCIVQDDTDDWQRQCPMMGDIYANSALTIAATTSSHSGAGFLGQRRARESPSARFNRTFRSSSGIERKSQLQVSVMDDWMRFVTSPSNKEKSAGLHSRAWCLQERLMPVRVLAFAEDEMYYECRTCEFHERSRKPLAVRWDHTIDGRPLGFMNRELCADDEAYLLLMSQVIEEYSHRSLSRTSDRLPAFSGISQRYSSETSDEHLAGLWRSYLLEGICWVEERRSRSRSLCDDTAPSWSWASCYNGILWWFGTNFAKANYGAGEPLVSIISAKAVPIGIDPFGQVSGGELVLTGWPTACTIHRETAPFLRLRNEASVRITDGECTTHGWVEVDTRDLENDDVAHVWERRGILHRRLTCLPIVDLDTGVKLAQQHWIALLLEEVNGKPAYYRRIEIFDNDNKVLDGHVLGHEMLENIRAVPRQTITII